MTWQYLADHLRCVLHQLLLLLLLLLCWHLSIDWVAHYHCTSTSWHAAACCIGGKGAACCS
jgi:hypothetical protein